MKNLKLYLEKNKKEIYDSSYFFFINLTIISFLLLILTNFNILSSILIFDKINLFLVSVIALVGSVLTKYNLGLIYKKRNSLIESLFYSSKYFFISLLSIIIINQFLKLGFITNINLHLTVLAIAFGVLTFYKNMGEVEKEIEKEKEDETKKEKIRELEFKDKFPRINNVWGLRSLVKWMYKEGWVYSFGLILVFLVGILLRLPFQGLPIQTLHDVYAANWILENIIPISDSGVIYWRVFPFTYILSFFLWGSNLLKINPDLMMKIPVSLFSIGTLFVIYLIIKNFDIPKKYSLITLLIISISVWSITYAHYLRFFSMMIFLIYLGVYFLIKYQKTKNFKFIFLFFICYTIGIFIEKPVFVLLGLFLVYSFGIFLKFKSNKKILIFFSGLILLMFLISIFAFNLSKPIMPDKFSSQEEIISQAKQDIFGSLSFDFYNFRILDRWFFPITIFALFGILLSIKKDPFDSPKSFLFWFSLALLTLSLLGVSKNTPRNLAFYGESFAILLGLFFVYFDKSIKLKIVSILVLVLILFKVASGVGFFLVPTQSGDFIPEGPARISEAKTFIQVHDLSLGSNFVKRYLDENPDVLIISSHSAAWENFYLSPYKVDFILNDFLTDYLTTVNIDGKLFSLYEGLEIINGSELKELSSKNKSILITNYDYEYRANEETKYFIESNEPIFISEADNRIKVYELIVSK